MLCKFCFPWSACTCPFIKRQIAARQICTTPRSRPRKTNPHAFFLLTNLDLEVTGREAMRPHNRWLPPPLYYCLAKWSGAKTIHTRYNFFSFSLLVVVDDSATNDKDTRLREMDPAKSKTSYASVFFFSKYGCPIGSETCGPVSLSS
jgi:hypothetical protein